MSSFRITNPSRLCYRFTFVQWSFMSLLEESEISKNGVMVEDMNNMRLGVFLVKPLGGELVAEVVYFVLKKELLSLSETALKLLYDDM